MYSIGALFHTVPYRNGTIQYDTIEYITGLAYRTRIWVRDIFGGDKRAPTYRHTDIQTYRHTDIQTDKKTNIIVSHFRINIRENVKFWSYTFKSQRRHHLHHHHIIKIITFCVDRAFPFENRPIFGKVIMF